MLTHLRAFARSPTRRMLQQGNGDVVITNDGATILAKMDVVQPAAKMLVELAKA